jgi:hypothetical protein
VSFVGAVRPLVQGENSTVRRSHAAALASSFVLSSFTVFAVTAVVGGGLGVGAVPYSLRLGVCAAAGVALACVDALRVRRGRTCSVGAQRQTPRSLMSTRSPLAACVAWGADTGLVVSTVRVTGLSWLGLLLVLAHVVPWWSGVAYGLAFALPLLGLLLWPPPRSAAPWRTPALTHHLLSLLRSAQWTGVVLMLAPAAAAMLR